MIRYVSDVFDAYWPYALTAGAVTILLTVAEPISRDNSHLGRMVIAGLAIGFVIWRGLVDRLGRTPVREALLRGAMVVSVTVAVGNYYQFDRDVVWGIDDYTDATYYYLNSKYLDELGYYGLYPAMLVADRDHNNRHAEHIRQVRDLRTYEVRPARQAFIEGERLRQEAFTEARWAQFERDVDFFLSKFDRSVLQSNFFVDHGYNPPPTWSLVGGTMASLTPVEHLKWICGVDMVLVVLTFACVGWAFGFEPMLFAMLFFLTTFSGRWPILGQAIMRFDWVCALTVSLCFLKAARHLPAGVFLAYAGLNRVFPLIFFGPWFFAAVRDTVADRAVPRRHQALAAGAGLTAVVMLGGALVAFGPRVFADSGRNLLMHNTSYSSHRVGLGDVLVFRGETTRRQINANGGVALKEERVQALQPILRLLGLVALGWILLYTWRTRREDWELLPLAILPFFCMTNPQINYYNLRLVLILWHAWHARSTYHRGALAWLLLIEVATQATKVADLDRYTTTTTTSLGMLVYCVALVVWMGRDMRAR